MIPKSDKLEATVIKNAGSHFLLSCLPEWKPFPAVLRGKVRLEQSTSTNPIAVGDRVYYTYNSLPDETNPATITEILPRKNYLIRRSSNLSRKSHVIAANLDQVLVVVSLYFPEIKLPFLDRVLLTCELYGISSVIVLNKMDLYGDIVGEQVENFMQIYGKQAGYPVIPCSAIKSQGIEQVRELCSGRLSLLTGESGVGKSSLIKAIDPTQNPKVGLLSEAHLQGKHTTSLYEMYRLNSASKDVTYIIDAPGLRGFGLVDIEKEEIYRYFPEMLRLADECRFTPCTHTHEPGCAIKKALEEGKISPERYNSYIGMLEEDKKFR